MLRSRWQQRPLSTAACATAPASESQLGFRSLSFPASAHHSHLGRAEEEREEEGDTEPSWSLPHEGPRLGDELGLSCTRLWVKARRQTSPAGLAWHPIPRSTLGKACWAMHHPLCRAAEEPKRNCEVQPAPRFFPWPQGPTWGAVSSAAKWQKVKHSRAVSSQLF